MIDKLNDGINREVFIGTTQHHKFSDTQDSVHVGIYLKLYLNKNSIYYETYGIYGFTTSSAFDISKPRNSVETAIRDLVAEMKLPL